LALGPIKTEVMNLPENKSMIIPSVTVIIPVYNEERSIENCIRSLRNQSVPLEIIVVDDGSKDNSVKICEGLGIKVLKQNHQGPGAARNLGARNAKGEILILVDADMEFETYFVAKLIAPITEGDAVATCHWNERVANWNNPWARCQTWFLGLPDKRRQPLRVPEYEEIYRAVKKDFFLNSGGFAVGEGRADDSSISKRTGVLAKIVSDAVCYHRNVEGISELLRDSLWQGRNVVVKRENRMKSSLITLVYKNPVCGILKGIILGIKKHEPRMPLYAMVYSAGMYVGLFQALLNKRYTK
jgi:glycosyltransferase involved in cell wall biosynthesis